MSNKNKRERKSVYDRFMALTPRQRNAEMARFDVERIDTPGKPLTIAQKAQHARARRRGRGRPRIGKGSRTVALTIELDLLKQADAYAKREGLKRSQLVAQALRERLQTS